MQRANLGSIQQEETEPKVFWLTGLSGAGKTTLAKGITKIFQDLNYPTVLIDGDEVRNFFENSLGFDKRDRIFNIKTIAFSAKQLVEAGLFVVVANISPYSEVRDFIRRKVPGYVELYVKASLETVMGRDVKGHYKRFQNGEISQMTGLDDRYDVPTQPDLVLNTEQESVSESLKKFTDFIRTRQFISL